MLNSTLQLADNITEESLSFASHHQQLQGILTLPVDKALRGAVIFSHGWSGNRCGPGGLLTELARALAKAGYAVLRFDFAGRGESEGAGLQSTLLSMADDLTSATQVMKARTGLKQLLYLGLCSGGNVVVGSLKRLPEAKGLILLSVYPFSDGDTFARDLNRTLYFLKVYWQKAIHPQTWKRLFRGDVRLGQVLRVLLSPLLKRGTNRKKEGQAGTTPNPADFKVRSAKATASESRLEKKAPPRSPLKGLRKNLPVLMLYGSADPDAKPATAYFGNYASEQQLPIRIQYLEGADHNFSSTAWRKQLQSVISKFLDCLPAD
ncbi:MAG: alpha/beta fold hydrolase [Lentisphaeria bacterium]